jgi:UDP-N-acetylmuramyl pentapeptide phosphotransferase/UDP-N-acetylglucosamine-1-phosphate transferase
MKIYLITFFEDISHRLSPKIKLLLLTVSAVLVYFLLDIKINRSGISFLEPVISIGVISFLFTVFAIVGVTNAINIIDGFNGLASGVSIMILIATAYVANQAGDVLIRDLSIITIFTILGFFVLNWPFGKIFLGDGGAYFLGFWIVILVISLIERNQEISPWFAMTVFIYPVWEVVFSIYRRKFIKKVSPLEPDKAHLHTLIYRKLIKKYFKNNNEVIQNSITSIFIWILNLITMMGVILFYNSTFRLIIIELLFIILYNFIYKKVVYLRVKI